MVQAVIWFADVREAKKLASTMTPADLAAMRSDLFDSQLEAVERHGGVVLPITGDGLLAVFSVEAGREPADVVRAALLAADEAFSDVAALNAHRSATARPEIRLGLALHVGEMPNEGGRDAERLDLASLDPGAALVVPLQRVTSRVGVPLVVSEAFAAHCPDVVRRLGIFELGDVARPAVVFVRK